MNRTGALTQVGLNETQIEFLIVAEKLNDDPLNYATLEEIGALDNLEPEQKDLLKQLLDAREEGVNSYALQQLGLTKEQADQVALLLEVS